MKSFLAAVCVCTSLSACQTPMHSDASSYWAAQGEKMAPTQQKLTRSNTGKTPALSTSKSAKPDD